MKILMAMSGGVDSSVAAYLLRKDGNEVIGCTMKLFSADTVGIRTKSCCSLDDAEDARSVAYKLGMKYYVFNFQDDFKDKVIDKFVKSYERGETPNPCVDCNRYMKFEKLYLRAKVLGCDHIATGHYARVVFENGRYLLKRALDKSKDQCYVLYMLTQEELAHTLFPLGDLTKSETRKIAAENGFVNADKPDSQDICFVPDGDHTKFIRSYTQKDYPRGDFISKSGEVLGRHEGIIKYTIGQRKGLGLSIGERAFVGSVDAAANTVTIVKESELYKSAFIADHFNWIAEEPSKEIECRVQTRYHGKEAEATALPLGGGEVLIRAKTPLRAVTAGQSAVLYDGETVLGGGEIREVR